MKDTHAISQSNSIMRKRILRSLSYPEQLMQSSDTVYFIIFSGDKPRNHAGDQF